MSQAHNNIFVSIKKSFGSVAMSQTGIKASALRVFSDMLSKLFIIKIRRQIIILVELHDGFCDWPNHLTPKLIEPLG